MVQAYFRDKVAAGTTSFVARSFNLAAVDPGGSVGVWGHYGPVRGNIVLARHFELWAFTGGRNADFPCESALFPSLNRRGVIALVGNQLIASCAAAKLE